MPALAYPTLHVIYMVCCTSNRTLRHIGIGQQTPQRFTPSSRAWCDPFSWFGKFCALFTWRRQCCPHPPLGLNLNSTLHWNAQMIHCTNWNSNISGLLDHFVPS